MAVSFWDKVAAVFGGNRPEYYEQRRRQRKQNKGKEQTSLVGQGFGDIFDRYGNMGADDSGLRTSAGISRGDSFNNTQLAEMQYNHDEAQLDRQWQEDMYRKYQSPEAQMRQYDAAGLNRALAYNGGVDINGPSGGSAASSDVATSGESPVNGFQTAMGVMSTVMELLLGGSNLATKLKTLQFQGIETSNNTKIAEATALEKAANARNLDANTEMTQLHTRLDAAFSSVERDLGIKSRRAEIANIIAGIQEKMSNISVNNSTIEVNSKQIDLMDKTIDVKDSEIALNLVKESYAKMQIEQQTELFPFVKERYMAETQLLEEQFMEYEKNAVAQRTKDYADASVALVKAAKEQGLLDAGYCDAYIGYMTGDTKYKESLTKTEDSMRTVRQVQAWSNSICQVVETGLDVTGAVVSGGATTVIGSPSGHPRVPAGKLEKLWSRPATAGQSYVPPRGGKSWYDGNVPSGYESSYSN